MQEFYNTLYFLNNAIITSSVKLFFTEVKNALNKMRVGKAQEQDCDVEQWVSYVGETFNQVVH